MAQLSLREAARQAGTSKSSLSRAVASGRVSVTRTEDGRLLFDTSELFRAFPPKPAADPEASHPGRPGTAPVGQTETAQILLEQQLAQMRDRLEEMRAERDEWRETAKAAINRPLMLPAPESRRGWWPFSRKSA